MNAPNVSYVYPFLLCVFHYFESDFALVCPPASVVSVAVVAHDDAVAEDDEDLWFG